MSREPAGFVRSIALLRDRVPSFDRYPFSIPAVRALDVLELDPAVTFLVGENGSGKSTLVEALAIAAGFNAEGGTKSFRFATTTSASELHGFVRLARGTRRERDGFFLRAESFFNTATYIDQVGASGSYGGRSLHEQSHGESFLALVNERFRGEGLYIMDEPEAALSPQRQLALLLAIDQLVRAGSQLVIATHSPILMAYPRATIYSLDAAPIAAIAYRDTPHYQLTRDFLADPDAFFAHLIADED